MQQQETRNFSITWRGKKFTLEMNPDANLKLLGNELLKLTNVRDDTMRLIVPTNKSSKLLYPFSEEHSSLKLEETSILEGKSIRMLGVLNDEVDEVLKSAEADLRIVGFDEEEKRLRQRMSNGIRTSPKLPQGPYIFCDFRTLQLPGVELHPPASNALKLMHTLAADPGIVAIMNKHRWRVGIMTEMAPEGYVGVSPACILGFNKNHGEEISLRLRTDDLKGFRKYQKIKETLLHELAHMVHSEHDANFHALDKQLNEEAATLDWTKSKSHTLSGDKWLQHHEQDFDIDNSVGSSYKLGGKVPNFVNARASSVAAAYNRLAEASTNLPKASETHQETNSNDSLSAYDQESKNIDAMQDCQLSGETVESMQNYNGTTSADESSENDRKFELDHDDTEVFSAMKPEPEADPDSDDHYITSFVPPSETKLNKGPDDSSAERRNIEGLTSLEPDPDEHGMETENEGISDRNGRVSLEYHVHEEEYEHHAYPKSNDVPEEIMLVEPDPDDNDVVSSRLIEEPDPDDDELRRIQDPVAVVCSRLQKAIGVLISETHPLEASRVLQTVLKIIRNAIEHPDEVKFRKLRKANPIIQKDVVSYQAAMEILIVIGFCEDVVMNELGRTEAYLVLKRNDPGLLWLAKSSLETSIASFT